MAKAWAKIVVQPTAPPCYRVVLATDLWAMGIGARRNRPVVLDVAYNRPDALARARAWSRRLGNIPVEVEESDGAPEEAAEGAVGMSA